MSESLFASAIPGSHAADAASPRTFGVDFNTAVAGRVSAIAYYVALNPTMPATVNVALFDPSVSTTTPLATGTGTPTGVGWLTMALNSAVTLTVGHTYTATAWISLGAGAVQPGYGFTSGALASDVIVGDLTALAHSGWFLNNTPSLTYPTGGSDINFFVDVVFTPAVTGTAAADLGGLSGSMVGAVSASGTALADLGQLTGTMAGHEDLYLYTPPLVQMTVTLEGALRYSYPVADTVWKDANGVWQHQQTPSNDELLAASQLLAVGGRPQLVGKQTAIELTAAGFGTIEPPVPQPVFGTARGQLGGLSGTLSGHMPPMPGSGTGLGLLGGLAGSLTGVVRRYATMSGPLGGLIGSATGVVRKYGTAAVTLSGLSGSAKGASPTRLGASWASGSITAGKTALNAKNTYIRIYSAGDPTAWGTAYVTDSQAALAAGGILHFSFKNTPTSTNVNPLLDGIPAGTKIWLTYHHEDEQGTGGDVPLATYQSGWAALRSIADAHPKRSQVILVGVLTEYRCTYGGENWQDWWTGHEDKMAVDCYNTTPSGEAYRTPADIWNIASQIASVTGYPAAVPEYGALLVTGDTTGSGRVTCINNQINYLRAHPGIVDAVSWFSYSPYDLASDSGLESAWRTLCNSQ